MAPAGVLKLAPAWLLSKRLATDTSRPQLMIVERYLGRRGSRLVAVRVSGHGFARPRCLQVTVVVLIESTQRLSSG